MIKKIIVISLNTSWNIYNFRLNLARALRDNGYRVVLVAPYDQYSDILSQEFEYYPISINNKGTNIQEDFKTLLEYYKIYKKINPYIALHYTIKPNIYGNIACNLLKIKTINNISGLGTVFIQESFITKIVKILYRYSLNKSSKVFFQNCDDQNLFIQNSLVSPVICDLLPGSGVDTNYFYPTKYSISTGHFKFLLIARILWDKGIGEYVEAAKIIKQKNPNIEFQLLGSLDANNQTAISKEQIQDWTKSGTINYLGTTDNVRAFIEKADCIVLPSYREGIPRSLLESASMEKPIIATNVPGCREVVENNVNGFLCALKNSKDLADKMERMINLPLSERISMGIKGRKKMIQNFEESIVISKYLDSINRN